ncbi:MAG TPA: hypothetical protein VFJ52_07715 [Terriglobia bacterium]|nr:hypothetical protein [Terriglobia bacterium]
MAGKSFLSEVGDFFRVAGKDALRVLGVVTQNSQTVAGIVSLADPAIAPEAQIIGAAVGAFAGPVSTAQAAYAAAGAENSGPQKLAAVMPATAQLVEQAMAKAGLVKIDDARFNAAIQELTQGTVDLWDSIGKSAAAAPAKG